MSDLPFTIDVLTRAVREVLDTERFELDAA